MPRHKFLLEELDDKTAKYLRDVRRTKGEGLAGIYCEGGAFGAWWMILLGVFIFFPSLLLLVNPPGDPRNVTMLLTAGLLLGGWLTIAGIRIYAAQSRGQNLGSFAYADPWWIWVVSNTKVDAVPLEPVNDVKLIENRDGEGNYQSSTLTLKMRGTLEKVSLGQEIAAREMEAYIDFWLNNREGQALTPAWIAKHAGAAKAYAFDQDEPLEVESPGEIPKPQQASTASAGWLNLLIVTAVGVGIFFCFEPLVRMRRDDAFFSHVRLMSPPELRAYLVDPRNTRHREDVQRILASRYEGPIANLKNRITLVNDPQLAALADPLCDVVKSVASATQPIITLRVREKPENPDDPEGRNRATAVQRAIVDGLLTAVGPQLLMVAQPPEPEVNAFIEITYTIVPVGADSSAIEAEVVLRKSPDSDPSEPRKWRSTPFPRDRRDQIDNELRIFVRGLTGGDPVDRWDGGGRNF